MKHKLCEVCRKDITFESSGHNFIRLTTCVECFYKLHNAICGANERTPVSHYLIPGTTLELIDIIKAKMTAGEWRKFCWASAIQYVYRLMDKGEPVKDAEKGIVYLSWFKESYK